MNNSIRFLSFHCVTALVATSLAAGHIIDLEDLSVPPSGYYNGGDSAGGFVSRGAFFNNTFTDYGGGFSAWENFAYSNSTDTTTSGYTNQYSAIPGNGAGGSPNYAVGYAGPPVITLPPGTSPQSVQIANTTYAYLSMRDGDSFAKKFGGASGNDPDFFLLSITGLSEGDVPVGSIDFYLADYRFASNSQDYLVNSWTSVDLSPLAGAAKLRFALSSTDNGFFGMNTPAYFALDNLAVTPEPGAIGLLAVATGALAVRRRRTEIC